MLKIEIEQTTFKRLQRHAQPFVDTPDMVLNRVLDAVEHLERPNGPTVSPLETPVRPVDLQALPDLKHTKVLQASLAGKGVVKPNWNLLLERVLILAMKQLGSLDRLTRICPANMVQGCKTDEGYRHLSEVDISFQGTSSNDACKALVAVTQSLRIGLEITFMWYPKEKASFPGERGLLTVPC